MIKQATIPHADQVVEQTPEAEVTASELPSKKLFVEPTISVPTDVLETTTFFQGPTIEGSSL